MALAGDLTEITIADADLQARLPQISSLYTPPGGNFTAQIAVGKADAIADFEGVTGRKADRSIAKNADDWKAIVVLSALLVVLRAATDDRSNILSQRFAEERSRRLQAFRYDYDADESDTIEESVDESDQRIQEIRLLR